MNALFLKNFCDLEKIPKIQGRLILSKPGDGSCTMWCVVIYSQNVTNLSFYTHSMAVNHQSCPHLLQWKHFRSARLDFLELFLAL